MRDKYNLTLGQKIFKVASICEQNTGAFSTSGPDEEENKALITQFKDEGFSFSKLRNKLIHYSIDSECYRK